MRPKRSLLGPSRASKRPRSHAVGDTLGVNPIRQARRNPDEDQEGEIFDHHARWVVNDPPRPDQASRVQRYEQQRLDRRAENRKRGAQRPQRQGHFRRAEKLQKERAGPRIERARRLDDLELMRLSAEQLAPEAFVEPHRRDREPDEPERRQQRGHADEPVGER
jgi:hypothetical protein